MTVLYERGKEGVHLHTCSVKSNLVLSSTPASTPPTIPHNQYDGKKTASTNQYDPLAVHQIDSLLAALNNQLNLPHPTSRLDLLPPIPAPDLRHSVLIRLIPRIRAYPQSLHFLKRGRVRVEYV